MFILIIRKAKKTAVMLIVKFNYVFQQKLSEVKQASSLNCFLPVLINLLILMPDCYSRFMNIQLNLTDSY